MSTKTRLIVDLGEGPYTGRLAVEALYYAHLANATVMGLLPPQLHNEPRHVKARWIWDNLPGKWPGHEKVRFALIRERKRLRQGRSSYMRYMQWLGIGKVLGKKKKAPVYFRPPGEAVANNVLRFRPPEEGVVPQPARDIDWAAAGREAARRMEAFRRGVAGDAPADPRN